MEKMGVIDRAILSERQTWATAERDRNNAEEYLLQVWFSLSDEGIEDSIYDSFAMRQFMHINFFAE